MTFLCDTNIISELARPQPNPGVLEWSNEVSSIVLSVITIEEITYGLTSKPNVRIQNWFNQFLNTYCQIMPITAEIAQCCGELRGQLRTQGKPRSQADMLIAATAQVHQLTLVTRNIRDFENLKTYPSIHAKLYRGLINIHAWVYKIETGGVYVYSAERCNIQAEHEEECQDAESLNILSLLETQTA